MFEESTVKYYDEYDEIYNQRRELIDKAKKNENASEYTFKLEKLERKRIRLERIIDAARIFESSIYRHQNLLDIDQSKLTDQERAELSELKEQLEEDIKESFRILPEELKAKVNLPENLKSLINPQVKIHKKPPVNEEPVIEKVTQKTPKENQSLLEPNFDFDSLSLDELRHLYQQESKKYQDNPEQLKKLTNIATKKINEKIRKDRYKYDEKGIPVFFEGTNIPRPRDRKVNEMDEEYTNFLKEYYEDLEKRGVLNQLQPQNVSGEEKDGKQLPAVTKELPVPISKEKPVPPPPIRPLAKPPVDLEEGRNFDRIIAELKLGLKIDDKSGKRYTASNVKVIKRFKNELKEKEKIYNITNFLPAIGRVIIGTISKYWSKWQLKRTEQKHTMKVLEDRINNLPEADLMVIYEKYRNSNVIQYNLPTAMNDLLNKRVQQFVDEKVHDINLDIAGGYKTIIDDWQVIEAINKELKDATLQPENRRRLETQKKDLLKGKAKLVKEIREKYDAGNKWYSGGAHGFAEDMKAASTKQNLPGKARAKIHSLDESDDDFFQERARISELEDKAVKMNNDEEAIKAFIEKEALKFKNTEVKEGFLGPKSVGKMYAQIFVGKLNYNPDPLFRNILTSLAMISTGISVGAAIKTQMDIHDKIAEQQEMAERINAQNQATMDQVHQTGRDISDFRTTAEEGFKAQAHSDVVDAFNARERGASTKSSVNGGGWSSGPIYGEADAAVHERLVNDYNNLQDQLQDVNDKIQAGSLTPEQVTQTLSDIATQNSQNLMEVIKETKPYFDAYMQTHPQFDLAQASEAMDYLMKNPDAIAKMNQGIVDVTNMGEELSGLSFAQVDAIQSLPSDLKYTLLGNLGASCLLYDRIKKGQTKSGTGRPAYQDDVMNLTEEYFKNREAQAEPHRAKAA